MERETSQPPDAPESEASPTQPRLSPEEELAKAREEAEKFLNNWRRSEADFQNFKKRTEQEREELRRFGNVSRNHQPAAGARRLRARVWLARHAPRRAVVVRRDRADLPQAEAAAGEHRRDADRGGRPGVRPALPRGGGAHRRRGGQGGVGGAARLHAARPRAAPGDGGGWEGAEEDEGQWTEDRRRRRGQSPRSYGRQARCALTEGEIYG